MAIKIMSNYYLLSWKDNESDSIAFAPDNVPLAQELIETVVTKDELPFEFTLRNGNLQDYLGNSLAWPIMSEKMKNIFEKNKSSLENISWIICNVKSNGQIIQYYLLCFNKQMDVLDATKTMYVPGTDVIIKSSFSIEKIKNLSVFTQPNINPLWKITPMIYVNEAIRKQILAAKLTGINFEKTRVS
jgi:hypothetical protein